MASAVEHHGGGGLVVVRVMCYAGCFFGRSGGRLIVIRSMTAFVSTSRVFPWGRLTWELRTVNHRFCELHCRLPEALRVQEMAYRQQIQARIARGKVDVMLKLQPGESLPYALDINEALVSALAQRAEVVSTQFGTAQTNVMDVLSWPGVVNKQSLFQEELVAAAKTLLDEALVELVAAREREGEATRAVLQSLLVSLREQQAAVVARGPEVLSLLREQMQARCAELVASLDDHRLEQELLILTQKLDVAEEMARLAAHCDELGQLVEAGGVVGRRLDFLLQELNREANTTASKSADVAMTRAAVEMKVLIEQFREQVQNIE